jgi:F-type H+-transporting ATPase subunit a
MTFDIFTDRVLFDLGPAPFTETMAASLGVSIVLTLVAVLLVRALARGSQSLPVTAALLLVDWLDTTVSDIIGREEPLVTTFSGSLFLFIAGCNLSSQLPGLVPATASLATTSALATIVFLAVPIAGIRARGFWGYVLHYFRPNPLFLPLHLLSELSRTVALSVRLFGNVLSGHLIVALLVGLAGVLVPTPMMALDVLIGLLQAYIFAVLATVYIGAAIGAGGEG